MVVFQCNHAKTRNPHDWIGRVAEAEDQHTNVCRTNIQPSSCQPAYSGTSRTAGHSSDGRYGISKVGNLLFASRLVGM